MENKHTYQFVEKLIERLEEIKTDNFAIAVLNEPYSMGICHTIEKSIKIVNQLAEEYNGDFCEWEADDKEIDVYYTKCGQAHIFIDGNPKENNHVFCPYCGKKIKVAPYQPEGE